MSKEEIFEQDEELEVLEDAELEDLEDGDDEDLQEVKASMGDPSEIADPVNKKAKKRRGDKDTGDSTLSDVEKKATKVTAPKTKAGAMNEMVKLMQSLDEDEAQEVFERFMDSLSEDADDEEPEVVSYKEIPKVSAEDIDISEDIKKVFSNDDSLSEEFVNEATVVFEAAVVSKINEHLEKIALDAEAEVELARMEMMEDFEEKLNDYLDYVAGEWMEENQLAVESGIKGEIAESVLEALHTTLTEHYVDIPENKIDVVEELAARAEELEEKYDAVFSENVELITAIRNFERMDVFEDVAYGLSETQKDKLLSLSEGVEFDSPEGFESKLNILREKYFGDVESEDNDVIVDDGNDPQPLEEETKPARQDMARYTEAISRSIKK